MLLKSRGFASIAVLTLALGIGANTALFSVVNGVLLNPLPFQNPDELYALYTRTSNFDRGSISYPNFLDWQKENRTFSSLSAFRSDSYNLTGSGQPERLQTRQISATFFQTLGINPVLGRNFLPEEDRAGGNPVAILGDGFWKRKFGSVTDILGKSILLNGQPYTVVGVAPSHIAGFNPSDIYLPIGQWTDQTFLDRRVSMGMNAIGRVKPGVSLEQAQADMNAIAGSLARTYPESNKDSGITVVPLKQDLVGNVRGMLLVLLGAVGFVLLIACANVGNLLLARSNGRAREFAIRSALGARATRIIRQLLTESVVLGLAGGLIGFILAKIVTKTLANALTEFLPRADEITMDTSVLIFTAAVSVLTGILFGLVPAIKMLRPQLNESLKEGGRGNTATHHRTQTTFVILQMAMALVLLIGAGLMIRTLAALWQINPGFDPNNAITFITSFTSDPSVTADELRAKYRATERQFESIPGVDAVGMIAGSLPMTGDSELPFWVEGQPRPANQNDMPFALFYLVTEPYQKAMGIPLLRGRFLSDRDSEQSPVVVVIDAAFAKIHFPNQNPVGKRLNISLLDVQAEIVGVVGHVEHWGLGDKGPEDLQAQMYLSIWQVPDQFWTLLSTGSQYVARIKSPQNTVIQAFREAVQKTDASTVLFGVQPLEEIVGDSISTQRLAMILLSVFAGLALALSAIGIYGVISYLTGQRTHEIGVRVALGASNMDVMRMILSQGMKLALIGVGIGIIAALALTRLISKLIYGVGAFDPITFAGVTILLTSVALLSCYIPARRAMRVDPMIALRYE
jgi:predicted permease